MLSPTQLTTLQHLMDRLIPPDDDLGAWEAGVGDYLLRQLDGDLRSELAHYSAGLDALDAEARASGPAGFSALPPAAQDDVLRRLETGAVVHAWSIGPAVFFKTVLQHVMEGYYSDPGNGGNRDGAAWRMIGFVPGVREDTQP